MLQSNAANLKLKVFSLSNEFKKGQYGVLNARTVRSSVNHISAQHVMFYLDFNEYFLDEHILCMHLVCSGFVLSASDVKLLLTDIG